MNKFVLAGVLAVILGAGFYLFSISPNGLFSTRPGTSPLTPNEKWDKIRVYEPDPGKSPPVVVKSPLTVRGEARGPWFFEASFPIKLFDGEGNQIAIVPAQAKGEWMTEGFVPFEAELLFEEPGTETGKLVLEKDNPSGLPEFDDSVTIYVRFK